MITLYIVCFACCVISFCGVKFLSMNIFGKSLCKISGSESEKIFLTFDDGPNPDITPKVLDLLKKYKQKATFFCIGRRAKEHPEIVRAIVEAGHTLGSHDLNHRWTSNFRLTRQMTKEIGESVKILEEICDGEKIIYYRPPFGLSNPHLFAALKKLDLRCVGWSKSVGDAGNRLVSAIEKIDILSHCKEGDIILLHDDCPSKNSKLFLRNLEELLIGLRNKVSMRI